MGMSPSASIRKPRASSASLKALYILCALSCLSLASCDWIRNLFPESFGPEYDDPTTNFIVAHAFAQPPLASDHGAIVALGDPAIWDWAWRGRTGNAFQYMTLSGAGTVGSAASSGAYNLAADTPAWRLELVNLAGDPYLEGHPNGSTPSGWESYNQPLAPPIPSASIVPSTPVSHGDFIRLTSYFGEWAGFDPNQAGFILDAPGSLPTATYLLRAQSSLAIDYLIQDPAGANFGDPKSATPSRGRVSFDEFSVSSAAVRFMTSPKAIGISQQSDLDDLRVLRTDLEAFYRVRLSLRPSDTAPPLVAGRYEFSVWVRRPSGALSYDDDLGRRADPVAPFAAKAVTLEIRQVGFLDAQDTPLVFYEAFEVGEGWTRLALRMGSGNLLRFDEASTTPVVELSIYPYDRQDPEPGAVLLAAPSLSFFVNGY